jgi:hypothetical protein
MSIPGSAAGTIGALMTASAQSNGAAAAAAASPSAKLHRQPEHRCRGPTW